MPDHNVRVCCRFRPFNDREKAEGALDEMRTKIRGNTIETDSKPFTFDHVFGMETQQDDLFRDVAQETVENVMDDWNGTVFACVARPSPTAHCARALP